MGGLAPRLPVELKQLASSTSSGLLVQCCCLVPGADNSALRIVMKPFSAAAAVPAVLESCEWILLSGSC